MAIDKFLNEMKVNNASESTITYYKSILLDIDRYKSLNASWTKDDIDQYLLVIRNKVFV
jgi:hypothetical protein